jgi:cytochrome P450
MNLAFRSTAPTSGAFRPPAPVPCQKPLGLVALIRALARNPIECWAEAHFEEPIVTVKLPFGEAVLVHEPKAVRRVLVENSANYRKDWLQRRVLSAGLNEGLLSAEGEQWQMQRRTLAPLFTPKTVMSFAPAMLGAAAALIERWTEADGSSVDIAGDMTRLTLDVLERTIFSQGLGRDVDQFRTAMTVYLNAIGRIGPLDLFGVPDYVPRLSRLRIGATLRFFEAAVDRIIATRRRSLSERSGDISGDILTLLLNALDPDTGVGMTQMEVRSNVLTFIAAGHETTANALAWSLFLLSQSPQWRERVEHEVDRESNDMAPAGSDRLVETRAVIEEAMRLYPPIAAISRVAIGGDELGGKAIRRGAMIVVAPYVLHRHRRLWTRADDFDPNRFMPTTRRDIDRFAYLPFGAGPRTCIGSAFALQEATLVLAAIVRNFRLELAPDCVVWPMLRVTLRPAHGLRMVIHRR